MLTNQRSTIPFGHLREDDLSATFATDKSIQDLLSVKAAEAKAEATLTAIDKIVIKMFTRWPSQGKRFSSSHTKLVPGMLYKGSLVLFAV